VALCVQGAKILLDAEIAFSSGGFSPVVRQKLTLPPSRHSC